MKIVRTALLSGIVVIVAVAGANLAFTAGNTVGASKIGSHTAAATAAALQPAVGKATGVHPTSIVFGSASLLKGTQGADLIIGTRNNPQTLKGHGGKDCLVAGSVPQGKKINMSPAADSGSVCVKGPGPGSYLYGPGCAVRV